MKIKNSSSRLALKSALVRLPVMLGVLMTCCAFLPVARADKDAGAAWVEATPAAAWSSRYDHAAVAFENKLWVLGGTHSEDGISGKLADVWYSTDGTEWTQATDDAGWAQRFLFGAAVFAGKIWVLGGLTDMGPTLNDVWCSADGSTWTEVAEHAPWPGRYGHRVVVFDDKLWVLGGADFVGAFNDVWFTEDGDTWTQVVEHADWDPRYGFSVAAFDESLWIFGGNSVVDSFPHYLNDVWLTGNEQDWTLVATGDLWGGRSRHATAVFEERIWIFGGNYGVNFPRETFYALGDVWQSCDGTIWTKVADDPGWLPRWGHQTVVFDNKLWLLGGYTNEGSDSRTLNDVWYLPSSASEGEGEGEGEPPAGPHTADRDGDWRIGIIELLRVIQFYNAGGFHCAANPGDTEDGYLPGADADQACTAHAADYLGGPSWTITLSELLRLIQLYNAGAYHLCPAGEGGYCPGAG